ncbi:hypothetical protein FH972_022059 [Carpinus fangiana]|uniref:Protein kinase domain-containing protein n=1 Tax=Carpinus fangiana TaxID=176857 RepID=A0A5N6KRN7_9ROSI|nr:hypothetical protein FH972_022059 [Carpinus fangiana]
MALAIGQTLRGPRGAYKLVESLKAPSVFKAKVLPDSSINQSWVVIKTYSNDNEKLTISREHTLFKNPHIVSSPYFRTCHDFIGQWEALPAAGSSTESSPCLVLQWMDSNLSSIPYQTLRAKPHVIRAVAKSILSALQLLTEKFKAVHTGKNIVRSSLLEWANKENEDINPHNVLVTDIDTTQPVGSLGDLGNVVFEGFDQIRAQSLATRAPEVWLGQGCWHSSDVWALGVTLVHSLMPATLFGIRDKMVEGLNDAWCIAKIARLIGPIQSSLAKEKYEEDFFVAEELAYKTFDHPDTGIKTDYIHVGSMREELTKAPGPNLPPQLIDFIESLLIIDHSKRPTAKDALNHPFLQQA